MKARCQTSIRVRHDKGFRDYVRTRVLVALEPAKEAWGQEGSWRRPTRPPTDRNPDGARRMRSGGRGTAAYFSMCAIGK